MESSEETGLDLGQALGASEETSIQVLTLYIPNKDRNNRLLQNQREWVLEAATLLVEIGGGVTIFPPVEGGWMNEKGVIIWEHPIILYTDIKPDAFVKKLPKLREFLHRMGRETNQGEVVVEFDRGFYRITRFDSAKENQYG